MSSGSSPGGGRAALRRGVRTPLAAAAPVVAVGGGAAVPAVVAAAGRGAGAGPPVPAVLVTILLAVASALLMALRYDPDGGSLAYYATDARASGFLVGAALAWVWRPPAWSRPLPRPARWGIDAAGIAALATLVVAFAAVSEFDGGLYLQGGFLWVGLLSAVLIVAATRRHGVVVALLSRRPAVAVGRRSYGLYLYHWPIFVLGRELP